VELIVSSATIRDIDRCISGKLRDCLLFLCNKHENFFFDVYNAQAEKFRRTAASEGILEEHEDDEEDEEDGEGIWVARPDFWEGALPRNNHRMRNFSLLCVRTR
jgi:hypothetical protein